MKKQFALLAFAFVIAFTGCQQQDQEAMKMKEQEEANKAAATRLFETAWNTGDFPVIDELIPADANDHASLPGKEPEKGPESFKKIIGMFRGAMPDTKMTILDEFAEGDKVVHRWFIEGTHTGDPLFGVPPSGNPVRFGGITIVRIEDGMVMDRWSQVDQLAILQQLGLVPPMGPPPAEDGAEDAEG